MREYGGVGIVRCCRYGARGFLRQGTICHCFTWRRFLNTGE